MPFSSWYEIKSKAKHRILFCKILSYAAVLYAVVLNVLYTYIRGRQRSRVDWPDELSELRCATFVFASNRIKIVLMARPRPCGRGRVVMNGLCGINRCSHSDLYQLAASDCLLRWSGRAGEIHHSGVIIGAGVIVAF